MEGDECGGEDLHDRQFHISFPQGMRHSAILFNNQGIHGMLNDINDDRELPACSSHLLLCITCAFHSAQGIHRVRVEKIAVQIIKIEI